jgi:hypothetical protein
MSSAPQERLFFLDVLKAICIVTVVSYHSIFVPRSTYESSFVLIDNLFAPLRFCVPVLLTISFLLLERSLSRKTTHDFFKKRFKRLLIPILFWFGFAGLLKYINHNSWHKILDMTLRGEIFTGAYYLLVLLQLTVIFIFLRPYLQRFGSLVIIIFIQVLVLLLVRTLLMYDPTGPIIEMLRIADRPLGIYWFGYIALGIMLYRNLPKLVQYSRLVNNYGKFLAVGVVGVLLGLEYMKIQDLTNTSIPPFEYASISLLFLVPILFLFSAEMNEENIPTLLKNVIKCLSHYSLGIFCVNGILSQIFLTFGSRWFAAAVFSFPEIFVMKLIGWLVLLLLSLGLSVLLSRLGLGIMVS